MKESSRHVSVLFPEEIEKLIENKEWKELKEILLKINIPREINDIWDNIKPENRVIFFRLLPTNLISEVFSKLSQAEQENILKHLSDNQLKNIILELDPDDRTGLFEELPGTITQKLLNILPYDERLEALKLLGYPEDSVGRLMTPDYIAVKEDWDIKKCLEHIRIFGKDAETINMIYVVDLNWHLIDSISIRKFILSQPDEKLKSIMDYKFLSISAEKDQEEAAEMMKRYDLVALPVIDKNGVLLGIVTVDDIMDVVEEETTEDFQKGAAVAPIEIRYTDVSPWLLYLKRVGWLSILMFAGLLSSAIISKFERTLNSVIALAFFIPILTGSGGNTATQSAILVIRAMAVGDLTFKKWFRVIKKEIITGTLLGATLGGLFFLLRFIIFRDIFLLGLTLALSTFTIILLANLVGALLPIILSKMKLDPAVISSPLLTTIIDSAGLLIYFAFANFFFGL
ncbi:MAG: magnesium transporter [Actinobacteria bacterium]|nr:magnesium transporter [Actinomycetota bacterium]